MEDVQNVDVGKVSPVEPVEEVEREAVRLDWSNLQGREQVKCRILGVPAKKRSVAENKVLADIYAEEKIESRMGAARHKLAERADRWGRDRLSAIVSEISSDVGDFSKSEKLLLIEAGKERDRRTQSLKAKAAEEMKAIQAELTSALNAIDTDKNGALEKIRNEFQPKYAKAEKRMKDLQGKVTEKVGKFVADIELLPLDKLEQLIAGKSVTHVTPDGARTLNLICPDQEK